MTAAVTCPALTLPEAVAQIDYSATMDTSGNLPFGTDATFHCEKGYSRVSGSVLRSCEMNGESVTGLWSGVEIVCEGEGAV